jgi:hypothetical protein
MPMALAMVFLKYGSPPSADGKILGILLSAGAGVRILK